MSEIENPFDEPLFLPENFEHPNLGKYKDKPESFFMGLAVRIWVDVIVEGSPKIVAVWLDVVGFEDEVVDGRPVRMGYGVLQKPISGRPDVKGPSVGAKLPFETCEVFDVIERFIPEPGGVFAELV